MPGPFDRHGRHIRRLQSPNVTVISKERAEEPGERALPVCFESTVGRKQFGKKKNQIFAYQYWLMFNLQWHGSPSGHLSRHNRRRRKRPFDQTMPRGTRWTVIMLFGQNLIIFGALLEQLAGAAVAQRWDRRVAFIRLATSAADTALWSYEKKMSITMVTTWKYRKVIITDEIHDWWLISK